MATETHNSWVEYDIAIEVIGKMIAEQNRERIELLEAFKQLGFEEDSPETLTNEKYLRYINRMREFQREINMIYSGEDVTELFFRVKNVYAPFLKAQYSLAKMQLA